MADACIWNCNIKDSKQKWWKICWSQPY